MSKLTKKQILEETITFYSEDTTRRALEADSCQYNTRDDKHCAVGRCLTKKWQKMGIMLNGNRGSANDLARRNKLSKLDTMLQVKYRGHSDQFWVELQGLHDADSNWNEGGLTARGETNANYLKQLNA